jgi:hypothetical protein
MPTRVEEPGRASTLLATRSPAERLGSDHHVKARPLHIDIAAPVSHNTLPFRVLPVLSPGHGLAFPRQSSSRWTTKNLTRGG